MGTLPGPCCILDNLSSLNATTCQSVSCPLYLDSFLAFIYYVLAVVHSFCNELCPSIQLVAHAAIPTNSDHILNTQWSLGQVTPFISSDSFAALHSRPAKEVSGTLMDERLQLIHTIQSQTNRRPHVVLISNTPLQRNSCMMFFPKVF